MAKQKTWIDLLGPSYRNCHVDGRNISRHIAPDRWQVIWSFETHQQALDAHLAWIEEIDAKKRADDAYIDSCEAQEWVRCGLSFRGRR